MELKEYKYVTRFFGGGKSRLFIIGANSYAVELLHEMEQETPLRIEAFVTYKAFKSQDMLDGIPVVAFEDIKQLYPNEIISVVIAIGYTKMNTIREKVYNDCREQGFRIYGYISPRSNVYSNEIGEGTIVRTGAHIGVNVKLGVGCIVNQGVTLTHDIQVKNYCFFGACSVFGGGTIIGDNCFFGLNCTVKNRLTISDRTLVGAGSLLLHDTEPYSVYVGNPARKLDKSSTESCI